MHTDRKVILYIATSLDGFIAKSDGDISFLSSVEKEGEDYGYFSFLETIDTVILGRKTYDKVLSIGYELTYGDRNVFVLTRNPHPETDKITFYSGSLPELISNLKSKDGLNIFCDGGAETVHRLLQDELIDELIVSIIPVLLGDGIRLFKEGFPEQKLQFVQAKSFEKGLVQLHYIRIRN
ncbi:MAG: dihydrofolate reductase family protein [Prolixibacteraceae bacterium]|jgi:dihydrofolate reductase